MSYWDPLIKAPVLPDANAIRIDTIGVGYWGKIVDKSVDVTIKAGETSGKTSLISDIADGYIVIKKITIPAGTKLSLYADGSLVFEYDNTGGTSDVTIDFVSEYGRSIYANTFDIELSVTTAPSSDTTKTVKVKGINVPPIQKPMIQTTT